MEGMTDFDRQISKRKQSKVTTGPLPIQESTSEIQNHQQAIRELALSNLTTKQSKKSISADRCSQERVLSSSDHNQTTSQQKELKSMEHCQSIINQRGIENQEEKCQTAGHNLPNVSRTQHSLVNHEIQINEPCFTKQQANRNRIQLARYRKSTLTMFLVLGLFILAYFPVICVQTIKSVIGYKFYSLKIALELSSTFLYMNAAINPVVYCRLPDEGRYTIERNCGITIMKK